MSKVNFRFVLGSSVTNQNLCRRFIRFLVRDYFILIQYLLYQKRTKNIVLRISNHRCISSCLHPTYSINGHLLNTVSEVRDLGIIVDSSLKFDKHISLIVRKAQQRAGLILKCFFRDIKTC